MTDKSQSRELFEARIACAIMAGTGATPEDCATAKNFVLEALADQPAVAGAAGEIESLRCEISAVSITSKYDGSNGKNERPVTAVFSDILYVIDTRLAALRTAAPSQPQNESGFVDVADYPDGTSHGVKLSELQSSVIRRLIDAISTYMNCDELLYNPEAAKDELDLAIAAAKNASDNPNASQVKR